MSTSTVVQTPPQLPSNARFGWVIGAALGCISAYCYLIDALMVAAAVGAAGALFATLALLAPGKLSAANRSWFAFGMLLGRVVSPIVLAAMYFLLITPVALIGRMVGRDALRLKKTGARSYWVQRDASAPGGDTSFKNQF